MAKTYEERMQDLRAGIPQGGTKSGKATTSGPTPTDTELVKRKLTTEQRRADDRAAAKASGALSPLRPKKPAVARSTYKGKTPADAVPRFIESLLGEEGQERSRAEEEGEGIVGNWAEFNAEMTDSMGPNWEAEMRDALSQITDRAALVDKWGAERLDSGPDLLADDLASQAELEINPDVNVNYDDPQAIADAATDHAAQYIYDSDDTAHIAAAAAKDLSNAQKHAQEIWSGDGPGGEGSVYFYGLEGGGMQRGYWVRDDGSVVNVTNILLPPSDAR